MRAEYYEQEAYENQLQIIMDLATRTASRSIEWKDVVYNPLSLIESDNGEGILDYVMTQMFTCTADISGIIYDIDLSENIDIMTGKGDIFLTVVKSGVAGFDKFDIMLSGDPTYDDTTADMLQDAYGDHPITRFADELVKKLHDAPEVNETFDWASFLNQDIPEEIVSLPLFHFGKKLFDTHDVLSFHKSVLDTEYRKSLF